MSLRTVAKLKIEVAEPDAGTVEVLRRVHDHPGRVLARGESGGVVELHDFDSLASLGTLRFPTATWVNTVAFCPRRTCLFAGTDGSLLRRWSLEEAPSPIITARRARQAARVVRVSPSGDLVALGVANVDRGASVPNVFLHDTRTLALRHAHAPEYGNAEYLVFSPDGRHLFARPSPRELHCIDTLALGESWRAATGSVVSLAVGPSGHWLVVREMDRDAGVEQAGILDARTGSRVGRLLRGLARKGFVACNPHGDMILLTHGPERLVALPFAALLDPGSALEVERAPLVPVAVSPDEYWFNGIQVLDDRQFVAFGPRSFTLVDAVRLRPLHHHLTPPTTCAAVSAPR